MLTVEKKEEIRREYFLKKKSIRKISKEMYCSRTTVRKAIRDSDTPVYTLSSPRKYPVLEPVIPIIDNWLKGDESWNKKQRHTAHRVWERLKTEYGFLGDVSTVRRYIHKKRMAVPEVFVPLIYQPGCDAQADWGEAKVIMDGKEVDVEFFAIRLCYSGACFVKAYPTQKQESFFEGHQQGFEFLGGISKRIIYDNLKTAVKKILLGRNRIEQDSFVTFRSHFLFESIFCQPGKGNEKGGVENLVGYVRRNFFVPIPSVKSFAELNEFLHQQCLQNLDRIPQRKDKSIGELLNTEKENLLSLPGYPFDSCRQLPVKADSCSRIQFETNKYSVPTEFAYQTLLCKAYPFQIKVICREKVIAQHPRSYERYQEILDPIHYLRLLEQKPGAFFQAKPVSGWHLPEVFEQFYAGLKNRSSKATKDYISMLRLLEEFSLKEVTVAVEKALYLKVYQTDTVRLFIMEGRTEKPISNQRLEMTGQVSHLGSYRVKMADVTTYNQLLKKEAAE